MKWPWSKKPEPNIRGVEYPDDWVPKHGDWLKVEQCHCGREREWFSAGIGGFSSGKHDACPKCGHTDKWEIFVARYTWEESAARKEAFGGTYDSDNWRRDEGIERWTPDHCNLEAPND